MLNAIVSAVEALPDLPAARRSALDALRQLGLPDTNVEEWRYTDLSVLQNLSAADVAPSTRNYEFPTAFDCGLDAFNTALAGGTQTLSITGRQIFDSSQHSRLRLKVQGDAELIISEQSSATFATFFSVIDVAPSARLRLIRLQHAHSGAHRLSRIKILMARDAQLEAVTVDLGGRFGRHDLEVHLNESGANAQLTGLYAPLGDEHVDNHTTMHHRAPHCTSRESYRGIVNDRARAVFNGKVVVHEGAKKTDSETRVANLLLSKKAEVYAKPELEIYNDDVKCAHGATFGQLDDNAIFYLRARGLSTETARSLLTYTFAHETLRAIGDEALRASVQRRFLERLPQGALLSDLL